MTTTIKQKYLIFISVLLLITARLSSQNFYWVGHGGDTKWNTLANWASASGGTLTAAAVPGANDNVIFDVNSNPNLPGSSFTVTLPPTLSGTALWQCKDFSVTGTTGPMILTDNGATNVVLEINGSVLLQSGMTYSLNQTQLHSGGPGNTITSNGVQFKSAQALIPYGMTINNGGSYTLTDALYASTPFQLTRGTLNTNNKPVTFKGFSGGATSPITTTLTLGSSTVNIIGYYDNPGTNHYGWSYTGSGASLNAAGSHMNVMDNGAFLFTENNHTYNTISSASVSISARVYGPASGNTFFNTMDFTGNGIVSGVTANRITTVGDGSISVVTTSSLSIGGNSSGITSSSVTNCFVAGYAASITSSTLGVCSTGGYVTTLSASRIKHCVIGGYAGNIGSSKFGYLSIGGDGNFGAANLMDSLKFSAGKIYTFQSATTHTITAEWSAISPACSGLLEIKSTSLGSQATVYFTGTPTATLTNVMVRDMKATGIYSPTGTGFDNGNNTNFTITSPASNSLYWVGGSGSWNQIAHWSTTSGGIGGACIPTPADNVFFDAGSNLPTNTSFTVTVPTGLPSYCRNMTWSGAPGTPLVTGSGSLTPLNIYGSMTLQAGMSYKVNYTNCSSTTAGETITTNGVVLGYQGAFATDMGLYINNGGSYGFTDNYSSTTTLFLNKGALTTNNNSVTIYAFSGGAVSPVTSTLTLGTSTVNLTSSGTPWFYRGSGTTLSAALSHINVTSSGYSVFWTNAYHVYNTFTAIDPTSYVSMRLFQQVRFKRIICKGGAEIAAATYDPASVNFGGNFLKHVEIASDAQITNYNTIEFLSIGGNARFFRAVNTIPLTLSVIDTLVFTTPGRVHSFEDSTTTSIRRVWDAPGTICNLMTRISSSTEGSLATINFSGTPTATLSNVMLTDMKAVGSITPLSCTGFDAGNNSGFTIVNPAPKTLYWVGGNGNWNDPDHWSTINNGTYPSGINGCVPIRIDDVVFGPLSNTFTNTSFTTTISGTPAECHNITWNGAPGNPTLTDNLTNAVFSIYGSSTWQTGMVYKVYITRYRSSTNETITSNNVTMTGSSSTGSTGQIQVNKGGSYVFLDNFRSTTVVFLTNGGINTNNKLVTMATFIGGSDLPVTTTLTLGTSTITIPSAYGASATSWQYTGSGSSLSANLSTINSVNRFTSNGFTGNPFVYNNITLSSTGTGINTGNVLGNDLTFNNVLFNTVGTVNGSAINANLVKMATNGTVIGTNTIDSLMIGAVGTITGTHTVNHCEITGVATVTGTNSIHYLAMKSNGFMNGSNISDTLAFNAGATYVLESAKTQTVTSRLYASGFSCAPINIRSSIGGAAANLRVLAGRTDFYYGRLTDINASALTFTYGIGSNNLGGNSNIIFDPISSPFSSGLGPDLLLRCDQYPYAINTSNFSASPLADYIWSGTGGPGTGSTFTANGPGTYSVFVAYSPGCSLSDAIVLTRTPLQPVTASVSNTLICSGLSSTLSASGVSSYVWSTGATTASTSVSPLVTSVYTVTGTDSNGCIDTKTLSVNVNTSPIVTLSAISNSICLGNNTVITPAGASTYTLLNTGTSATSFTLVPGATTTYSVVGTSTQNCLSLNTATTLITVNALPVIAASTQTNVLCFGGATGAASITVVGGLPNYAYHWSAGVSSTTNTAAGLSLGSYTVTVTDANNCLATQSIAITQPSALSVSSAVSGSVACFVANTGSAQITPTGGTPGYTYSWTPGVSSVTNTATGLVAGNYTATVKDANLCTITRTFVITQPASAASVSSAVSVSVACFGANTGSASVTPTGGTPGYTYSWLPGISSVTNTATGLAAGNYTATVKDANLCASTRTFVITQPANAVSVSSAVSGSVACFGANTGSASVTPTGGTPGYTYSWLPAVSFTTNTANGLAAGNYTAIIKDANLCTSTQTFVISQPASAVSIASAVSGSVTCFGANTGSAQITPTGGTPGYTYSWFPAVSSTTNTASGLAAGNYTATVKDANLCTSTQTFVISQPATALSVSSAVSVSVACFGANTGSVQIIPTGGTPGYTYTWLPSVSSTTNTATGLAVGNYTAIVKDANLCISTQTFVITQPASALSIVSTTSNNASCFGTSTGSAAVVANGGTPAYTYSWLPGISSTTNSATGLAAGNYTATVRDANLCSTTQLFIITEPTALIASVTTTTQASCGLADGSATIAVSGGTPVYNYSWTPPSPATSFTTAVPTSTNLIAGVTQVNVTDVNGCLTSLFLTITNPNAPLITPTQTNVLCYGLATGAAEISVTAGTAPYTYTWSASVSSSTNSASGLSSGTYIATVTDAVNCSAVYVFAITQPLAPLTATAVTTQSVLCYGASTGLATVNVTGGTPSYTLSWESNTSTTNSATAYAAGNYTYQVVDANGCSASHYFVITQPTSPLSISSFTPTDVLCFGEQTGSANVLVTGGSPGYTYNWQPGNMTTPALTHVSSGSYTLVVNDSKSCTTHSVVSIKEVATAALSTYVVKSKNAMCKLNDGSITVGTTGGSPTYTYQWNTGVQGSELVNVPSGNYSVITTDTNGCLDTLSIIMDCEDLFIPELVSPNGDGKNDKFEIKAIDNYPNNTLQIFNRWGSLVYEKEGYSNEWDGKASVGDAMGKSLLPRGTYYIVLDFGGKDQIKPYHGFVELVY